MPFLSFENIFRQRVLFAPSVGVLNTMESLFWYSTALIHFTYNYYHQNSNMSDMTQNAFIRTAVLSDAKPKSKANISFI